MQKVLSQEVTTAQNAVPPDFEGELSLFAPDDPGCGQGCGQGLRGDNETSKENSEASC